MRTMISGPRRRGAPLAATLLAAGVLGLAPLTAGPAAAVTASVRPAAAAALVSQDWPTYLQNAARTDATTDASLTTAGAPNPALDWTYQNGGADSPPPAGGRATAPPRGGGGG